MLSFEFLNHENARQKELEEEFNKMNIKELEDYKISLNMRFDEWGRKSRELKAQKSEMDLETQVLQRILNTKRQVLGDNETKTEIENTLRPNKDFLREFKSYLNDTSEEQFIEDWKATEKYAKVVPTAEEYNNNK